MSIYSIYRITNSVNGKNYIGYTCLKSNKRFNLHVSNSKNPIHKGALLSAIRKYGRESFYIEIIAQSKDRNYALTVLEPMFIAEYKAKGKAEYNLSMGGEGSPDRVQSPEERAMRSKMMKEISSREEVKKLKGKAVKDRWKTGFYKNSCNTANWEITHPDGTKEIIRDMKSHCSNNAEYYHILSIRNTDNPARKGKFIGCIIKKITI